MSVLETPRIYFAGEISWDPVTTNNYDTNYDEADGATTFTTVAGFREQAINQVVTAGNWNPHGTHRSRLFETAVNGFDLGAGTRTQDPFVSVPVDLTGMLVDLEPYGAFSSQLFFDSMLLGVRGGYRISAMRSSRFTARYVNFARNSANNMIAGIASVVWQTSFAKDAGLVVDPFDSVVLHTLAGALEEDNVLGLTVRFNTYRTVYFDDPTLRNRSPQSASAELALQEKLKGGGFQPNPARSLVVGVLGLWCGGEPMQEPGDRALLPGANSPVAGGAQARVTTTGLVLDLSNSVPETDADLTKQNLGTLSVVAVEPDSGATTDLATVAYDQYDHVAYEASAGIVTIPLDPDVLRQVAVQDLHVTQADGTVVFAESARRAVPLTPNLYLEEGHDAEVAFQVYQRGEIAARGLPVTVYRLDPNGRIDGSQDVETDADGRIMLPFRADTGRVAALVPAFSTDEAPTPDNGIDPQRNTYLYVRIRPADAAVATLPATWDNVYTHVLANWNAIAPCMDNWLRLDDPEQVRAHAAILKRLTDPEAFECFRFMPVTRDMSAGQRTLLYRFLDAPDDDVRSLRAEPEKHPTFVELSRSMRVP